jgi:hypothetical protein
MSKGFSVSFADFRQWASDLRMKWNHYLKICVQAVYCTSFADFLLYGVGLNWGIKVNYTRQHVTSVYADEVLFNSIQNLMSKGFSVSFADFQLYSAGTRQWASDLRMKWKHHLKIYVQGVYCTSLADFLLYGVGLNWRIKVNYTRQHVTSVYAERPTNLKEWSRAGASDRGKVKLSAGVFIVLE